LLSFFLSLFSLLPLMESLNTYLLVFHIAFGTLALLVGPVNMIVRKGTGSHRQLGHFFFYSMMVVSASAIVMSATKANYFLFLIGVFSAYLAGTGYRAIGWKRLLKRGRKPKKIDWYISLGMLAFGTILAIVGIVVLIKGHSFGWVSVFFGILAVLITIGDIRILLGINRQNGFWMRQHVSKMVGANIATYTAFIVVNAIIPNQIISWILPTVLGVPIIIFFQRKLTADMEKEQPVLVDRSTTAFL